MAISSKQTKKVSNPNPQNFGKIPPQAVDLEEAVLGAIMFENDALLKVINILSPECFYKSANEKIFKAIIALYRRNEPIDIHTVHNELKTTKEIDDPFYVSQLTNRVASGANVEFHSRIIFQKYIQRKIITQFSQGINDAFDDGADSMVILENASKTIDGIHQSINKTGNKSFETMVSDTAIQISKASQSESRLFGLPTGFNGVDSITSGRCNSDLVIIAARPSVGKTTYALQEAINIGIRNKIPVGIISLEMPYEQLIIKMLANEIGHDSENVKSGKLGVKEKAFQNAIAKFKDSPIYINDSSSMNISEVQAQARIWHHKHQIQILFVDYIQLITGERDRNSNREQEISSVGRGLKSIAKNLRIPVVALSQLNRKSEERSDHEPMLSDLRESGSLEQEADVVQLIYRPEMYKITVDSEGNDLKDIMKVNVAKNRNGRLGSTCLKFKKEFSQIYDYTSATK